jgi:pantetheine-phosphate adenylyltransferase
MKNIAIFPGSFDPITVGHVSIVKRALPLFKEIIIAIGINSDKKSMFSVGQRETWIRKLFKDEPKVRVETYSGLTVDFCKQKDAGFILRGLRTAADFEFERGIGQVNRTLGPGIETLFLLTEACHTPISSSIVRDVIRHGGDVSSMVPKIVEEEYLQVNTVRK